MSQLIPFALKTVTYVAGGSDQVNLSEIPARMDGRVVNIEEITFDCDITPTISGGTTPGATALQALVSQLTIQDSVRTHFDGSFATLRLFEALENGKLRAPEPDAVGTGEQVNIVRCWRPGLITAAPRDFNLPAAACGQGATIDFKFSATTAVHANVSAVTMTIRPIAWLSLGDDVVLPSMLERKQSAISKDGTIVGEAFYAFLALADTSALGVIAAGDFADITINAAGVNTKRLHVTALERSYHAQMNVGGFSEVHGEIRAATDDNPKVSNGTAIAAAASVLSPVIWTPPGSKLSKLQYGAQNELTIGWSGTQAAAFYLASRIMKRTSDAEAQYLATMQQKLGVRLVAPKVPTISKAPYSGPRARYLPVKFKIG
jgi:hypothetical protein